MPVTDLEVERLAQAMIEKHGAGAARASVERLNEMIERRDWGGRDVWARIVHAIHQEQGGHAAALAAGAGAPHAPSEARSNRLSQRPRANAASRR